MDIKKLRDSHALVEQLETVLQRAYETNDGFNTAIDEAEILTVKSLKDSDQSYLYKASEILYWVDRKAYLDELDNWVEKRQVDEHAMAIRFIKDSDQRSVFLDLVIAMRNRRIAPFIGAGLSKPCGYPMWGETLCKIALKFKDMGVQDIEPMMAHYDYLVVPEKFKPQPERHQKATGWPVNQRHDAASSR